MKRNHPVFRILNDIVGFALLAIAVLLGPIPGPGGIPIFIAGLSLLANNHEWAKRLLATAKKQGTSLYTVFFPEHKLLQIGYDIMSVALLTFAGAVVLRTTRNLYQTIALFAVFFALGILLANRKRMERLVKFFSKRLRKP